MKQAGHVQRSSLRPLLAISLATFVFHLLFGLYYVTHSDMAWKPSLRAQGEDFLKTVPGWGETWENDTAAYNRAAIGVLQTGVPRNRTGGVSIHAPLAAYFVAACYFVGGVRLLSVAVPQALLNGLICLLLGLAAMRICPRQAPQAGWITGALFLVNLRLAIFVGYVSGAVLVLVFFAVILFAASGSGTPAGRGWFIGGTILGIYTQASFFVVAAAAAAWLLLQYARRRQRASLQGLLVLVLFIGLRLVLPLINFGGDRDDGWRSTDRGGILWEANNPYYESMHLSDSWGRRPGNPWSAWKASDQEQQRYDSYWQRAGQDEAKAALLWIRENPAAYARLCLIRLRTELGPFTGQMSPRNRMIAALYYLAIFPAGLYGLWRLARLDVSAFVFLVIAAIVSFDTLVMVEWYMRYRMPVDLCMTVYAGITYAELGRKFLSDRFPALQRTDLVAGQNNALKSSL